MHNNLAVSCNGWSACVHNSVVTGRGKIMMYNFGTGRSADGPEANEVTSIRYFDLEGGLSVLCVCSTNGTQIYTEDATTMLLYAPLNSAAPAQPGLLKCHQGACSVPALRHIVIGTSEGSLVLVQDQGGGKFAAAPESAPGSAASEVTDVCFSAAAQAVFSVHTNGELRMWAPSPTGPYTNTAVVAGAGQAPVRVLSLGARLAVAYGPGTVCLFDALSHECQVEITAHARWLTAVSVREELGQLATVGEDTVLNVWQVDSGNGHVSLLHTSVVADKLLTGAAFHGETVNVTAYDSDELYTVAL